MIFTSRKLNFNCQTLKEILKQKQKQHVTPRLGDIIRLLLRIRPKADSSLSFFFNKTYTIETNGILYDTLQNYQKKIKSINESKTVKQGRVHVIQTYKMGIDRSVKQNLVSFIKISGYTGSNLIKINNYQGLKMFLCGNVCNGDTYEPQITVNKMTLPAKILTSIETKSKRTKKQSSVMLKKSKYKEYLEECKRKQIKFTDKDFLPDQKTLDYKVEGRSLTWKRVTQMIPDCVMVEDEFSPEDICQGNIGDCYFLSSIAALAGIQQRICNVFHDNFEVSQEGIYKLIVVNEGIPSEMIIDDYVPVFAQTGRPVFCKPNKKQIWVMLIEKAWAKIKGSYGAISAGCPHEVLNAFSLAPCYFYQIQEQQDDQYKDLVWQQLVQAADQCFPVVAGTRSNVKVEGLLPAHAYTILDCETIPSNGKEYRIMRLRNPWGKTQYTGFASQTDEKFWNGTTQQMRQQFRPAVGVNDGDFTMPFDEFMRSFQSVDISNTKFGFSYEFERVKMFKGEPLFVRLNVKQEHEGYITIKRQFGEGNQGNQGTTNKDVVTTNYGYGRIVVAYQRDSETYQYYGSWLQFDFPDINLWLDFKIGSYLIMIEIFDPRLPDEFESTFGYYYDTFQEDDNKEIIVETGKKYPNFLDQVWMNHAIRMNEEKTKIGPKPEDWIKTQFLYYQGGYGYVVCNLQHDTSIRMAVNINKMELKQNGFYLVGQQPQNQLLSAGDSKIFVLSCSFQGAKVDNIVFPPTGFKISRIS